jgi:hypothetical protein
MEQNHEAMQHPSQVDFSVHRAVTLQAHHSKAPKIIPKYGQSEGE